MNRWATLDGLPPRIIAHRGASGQYPEHVLPGYAEALEQTADIVEPDLVMSRDGVLVCRHDLGLARSTDIAVREAFAARQRDGDWWCWDLDAGEIGALGAVQPYPGRDRSFDGRFHPPSFREALAWAGEESARRATAVCLYPELKHPCELAARGLDPVPAFLADAAGRPPGVDLLVQCFDVGALKRVVEASGLPGALLLDADGDPLDAMRQHDGWLAGVALSKRLLLAPGGAALVAAAHERALRVDAWTLRLDPAAGGVSGMTRELDQLARIGVDRLFCDQPGAAREMLQQCCGE